MGGAGDRVELEALRAWKVRQSGRFELVRGLMVRLRTEAGAFERGPDYEDVACAVLFDLIADMMERLSAAMAGDPGLTSD